MHSKNLLTIANSEMRVIRRRRVIGYKTASPLERCKEQARGLKSAKGRGGSRVCLNHLYFFYIK